MTNAIQNAEWLAMGFVGKIPVWNLNGVTVGYRATYSNFVVTWNANYRGETKLVSKDFGGGDVQFDVAGIQTGPTVSGTGATPIQGGTASNTGTGTGTGTNVSGSQSSGGIVITQTAPANQIQQYKMPLIIGAGTVAALWLLTSKR